MEGSQAVERAFPMTCGWQVEGAGEANQATDRMANMIGVIYDK